MLKKNHPFHMVEISPWPFLASLMALTLTSSMIIMMHMETKILYFLTMLLIVISSLTWWLNVSQEALSQGVHMKQSMNNLKIGMILFISSEVMFFSSFFWAYFHSSISPSMELGAIWPPSYIFAFNPMNIPLLNTLVLLSSGISITWAHHSILSNNLNQTNISMILTILLGLYFTLLQLFEYFQAQFSIADSTYGATFFVATGFHGLHVIIGSIFILISWYRINILMTHPNHIVGFETAAWYWHFVDVVWLFLYSSIYWWGTN